MPLDQPHMLNLTPKQRAFVMAYVASGNATQAAISAGYSERTARAIGPENLQKPAIAEAIRVEAMRVATDMELSEKWVLERLMREATLDGDDATHSARVTALATLSKCLGMQLDKKDLNVRGDVNLSGPWGEV
ncbi:MAG: terminase small subunit [Pseudomonadota bacterium]